MATPQGNQGGQFFQGAFHNEFTGSTFVLNDNTDYLRILDAEVAPNAILNAGGRADDVCCYPGTREDIISKMESWMASGYLQDRHIFWLSGPAGAGKSAIVQTVADNCTQHKISMANFFFFRGDPTRNYLQPVVATLLLQLTLLFPTLIPVVIDILRKNRLAFKKSIRDQFMTFIDGPIRAMRNDLAGQLPIVLLIDGLDECDSQHDTRKLEQTTLLRVLHDLVMAPDSPFIVLVACRVESHLDMAFNELGRAEQSIFLNGDYRAAADIRRFVTEKLTRIKGTHPLGESLVTIRSLESIIDAIVKKSSGHFIYPATVVRFIVNAPQSPALMIEMVLGARPLQKYSPFAEMDATYLFILSRSQNWDVVSNVVALYRIVQRETESLKFSRRLKHDRRQDATRRGIPLSSLGWSKIEAESCFSDLISIVKVSVLDGRITLDFYHASFLDFIHNTRRAGAFHIDYSNTLAPFLISRSMDLETFELTIMALKQIHHRSKSLTRALKHPPVAQLPRGENLIGYLEGEFLANVHRLYAGQDQDSYNQICEAWLKRLRPGAYGGSHSPQQLPLSHLRPLYSRVASEAMMQPTASYPRTREHVRIKEDSISRVEADVISKVVDWMTFGYRQDCRIFWLSGPATARKSAIIQTVAENCKMRRGLVANFRYSGEHEFPYKYSNSAVVPTLLYQLFQPYPDLKWLVDDILGPDSLVLKESLYEQFMTLVDKPVRAIRQRFKGHPPIVLLIDMDRIFDPLSSHSKRVSVGNKALEMVRVLHDLVSSPGSPFIALVASEVQPGLSMTFNDLGRADSSTYFGNDYRVDKDIRSYITTELAKIKNTHPLGQYLDTEWPPESDIDALVGKSAGKFSYVRMVARYIANSVESPANSMQRVLDLCPIRQHYPFDELGAVSSLILSSFDCWDVVRDIIAMDTIMKRASWDNLEATELNAPEEEDSAHMPSIFTTISTMYLTNVSKRRLWDLVQAVVAPPDASYTVAFGLVDRSKLTSRRRFIQSQTPDFTQNLMAEEALAYRNSCFGNMFGVDTSLRQSLTGSYLGVRDSMETEQQVQQVGPLLYCDVFNPDVFIPTFPHPLTPMSHIGTGRYCMDLSNPANCIAPILLLRISDWDTFVSALEVLNQVSVRSNRLTNALLHGPAIAPLSEVTRHSMFHVLRQEFESTLDRLYKATDSLRNMIKATWNASFYEEDDLLHKYPLRRVQTMQSQLFDARMQALWNALSPEEKDKFCHTYCGQRTLDHDAQGQETVTRLCSAQDDVAAELIIPMTTNDKPGEGSRSTADESRGVPPLSSVISVPQPPDIPETPTNNVISPGGRSHPAHQGIDTADPSQRREHEITLTDLSRSEYATPASPDLARTTSAEPPEDSNSHSDAEAQRHSSPSSHPAPPVVEKPRITFAQDDPPGAGPRPADSLGAALKTSGPSTPPFPAVAGPDQCEQASNTWLDSEDSVNRRKNFIPVQVDSTTGDVASAGASLPVDEGPPDPCASTPASSAPRLPQVDIGLSEELSPLAMPNSTSVDVPLMPGHFADPPEVELTENTQPLALLLLLSALIVRYL